jgi:flagellar motor switch protein FliN/FliY
VEVGNAPTGQPAASGWMSAAEGTPFRVWLEWQLNAPLVGALRMAEAKAQVLANAQAQLQAQPPPAVEEAVRETTARPRLVPENAEHLMDVGLTVTLRFGGRRMLLGEVLELNSGSVVELDRQVHDPADLLLEGRVIARGEVVVVDGNYGLRVTEVVSPAIGATERKAG